MARQFAQFKVDILMDPDQKWSTAGAVSVLIFYLHSQCSGGPLLQCPILRWVWKGCHPRFYQCTKSWTIRLLCEVKAMEISLQAFQNYKSDRAERPTASRYTSNSNSHNSSNNWMPRVVQFVKRKQESYPSGNPQYSHDRGPTTRSGSYDPCNRLSGGNNYNRNRGVKPP